MIVTIAIPLLFAFIFVEYLYSRQKKYRSLKAYVPIDTLSNLAAGITSRLTKPFMGFFSLGIYALCFQHLRLFDASELPQPVYVSLLVVYFFGVDACYYFFHRASHRVNVLWGLHIIHHQSEKFNLSVAFRQTAIGGFFTFFFYLPLAVLGLPPLMFAIFNALNLLYQFFIHTELVGKLGFLEIFMNTPSHHRVHHGKDKKYIDKNYAGVFIIWDKWFGTFQPEEERPNYGVTTPPPNFNPIAANVHFFQTLWEEGKSYSRVIDKIALWFLPPEAIKGGTKATPFSSGYHIRPAIPQSVTIIFTVVVFATLAMLFFYQQINLVVVFMIATALLLLTELPFTLVLNSKLRTGNGGT